MAAGHQRVVATFDRRSAAESAAASLKEQGFEPRIDTRNDEKAALQGQMRDEAATSLAGPGVGGLPPKVQKGVLLGGATGVVTGAVLGLVAGLIVGAVTDMSMGLAILICMIVGVVACVAAGVVFGGGSGGEAEVQTGEQPADRAPVVVGVDTPDDESAERVTSVFGRFAPSRVDRIHDAAT